MDRWLPGCTHSLPSEGRPDRYERDRFLICYNQFLGCQTDDFYGALGLAFKPTPLAGEPHEDNQAVNRAFKCHSRDIHPDKRSHREAILGREFTPHEVKEYETAWAVIRMAKDILSDVNLRDQYHYYLRVMHGRLEAEVNRVTNVFNCVQDWILETEMFV